MLKSGSSVLLAAFALFALGCQEQPPKPQSAADAVNTYHSHLAQTCADKHKENLSPDALNRIAKDFYTGLDLNSRQRVDALANQSCAVAGASRPDCYNTAFLAAVENIGESEHFAVAVCAAPHGE